MNLTRKKGIYLGTEINEKCWKRYTKDKLFMRGNGTYWYDTKGFYFHRYLTRDPIFIPFHAITDITLGTWHSGRWAYGNYIMKLVWEKDNVVLSSGFVVAKNRDETNKLKVLLEEFIAS